MIIEPHEDVVLGGLIPQPGAGADAHKEALDNLRYLPGKLDPDILPTEHRMLAQCCRFYAEDVGWAGALTLEGLLAFLQSDSSDPAVTAAYLELFNRLSIRSVTQAAFRFSARRYVEQVRDRQYEEALAVASAIRLTGVQVKVGRKDKLLKGFDDSYAYLKKRIAEIDQGFSADAAPETDVREEADATLAEMRDRRDNPDKYVGMLSGLGWVDSLLNGARPGDLGFVCGFTESGKSHVLAQWAHSGTTRQRLNGLLFTFEMPEKQVRQRIHIRHARDARFGLPAGISAQKFKLGQLSPAEEAAFEAAMIDFKTNPAYGRLVVVQPPSSAGVDYVVAKMSAYDALWKERGGLHYAMLDSLKHAKIADGAQFRTGLNDNIKATRKAAMNFDGGRGVPIISTWHTNRKSYDEALEKGEYSDKSWSEADELENSAVWILWLLFLKGQRDRKEMRVGLGKNRDGAGHEHRDMYADLATGYVGEIGAPALDENVVQTGAFDLY